MVIITLKTIVNEKVGYNFFQVIYDFGYDKKWLHVRNSNVNL